MRAHCVHRARHATACPSSVRERRACTWHTGWAAWFPHCGCSGPRIFHPVSNRWSCPWKSFVRAWSQSVRVVHRLSSWRPVLHAPAAQSKVSSGLADPLPLARAMPLLRRFFLRETWQRAGIQGRAQGEFCRFCPTRGGGHPRAAQAKLSARAGLEKARGAPSRKSAVSLLKPARGHRRRCKMAGLCEKLNLQG